MVYASKHIGIRALARDVSLKEHVGFSEGSIESFIGRVCKEIEL